MLFARLTDYQQKVSCEASFQEGFVYKYFQTIIEKVEDQGLGYYGLLSSADKYKAALVANGVQISGLEDWFVDISESLSFKDLYSKVIESRPALEEKESGLLNKIGASVIAALNSVAGAVMGSHWTMYGIDIDSIPEANKEDLYYAYFLAALYTKADKLYLDSL